MATLLTLYKVWCTTPEEYQYVWATSTPTVCPSDGSGIDTSFISSLAILNLGNSVTTITDSDSPYTPSTSISINCDTSSGNITVNLPTAVGIENQVYHFVKTSASNTVTINGFGGQTIGGQGSVTLTFNENQTTIASDGSNWGCDPDDINISPRGTSAVAAIQTAGSGTSIIDNRLGNVFQLKSLIAGSNKIDITDDTVNKEVDIDVNVSNLINDAGTGTGDIWSADKIQTELDNAGDVTGPGTSKDNAVCRFDGTTGKIIQGPTSGCVSYDDSSAVAITGAKTDYMLRVNNSEIAGGGNGMCVSAGEVLGDIVLHISDSDNTFDILEIESDQGYMTLGKTYAQTLTDNGVVYGVDNEHNGNAADINTQDGVYRIAGRQVIYGTDYTYTVSEAESSTTSTTYQEKVTLTTPTLLAGTYRLGYQYEISHATNGQLSEVRVRFDGTEVSVTTFEADNDYHLFGGFEHRVLTTGVKTADIYFRTAVGDTGATVIRRARLEFWRVA